MFKCHGKRYHVYQDVWEVSIGEILPYTREVGNGHDPYAIAVDYRCTSTMQNFVYLLYIYLTRR